MTCYEQHLKLGGMYKTRAGAVSEFCVCWQAAVPHKLLLQSVTAPLQHNAHLQRQQQYLAGTRVIRAAGFDLPAVDTAPAAAIRVFMCTSMACITRNLEKYRALFVCKTSVCMVSIPACFCHHCLFFILQSCSRHIRYAYIGGCA